MYKRQGRIVGEPDEEGELVNVQVTLTCGKSRCVQEFYICVYPRLLDEEERFRKGISEKIARQQPEAVSYTHLVRAGFPVRSSGLSRKVGNFFRNR